MNLEDHLAADPAVKKAADRLVAAQTALREAQETLATAQLRELDNEPGSATKAATAARAVSSATEDLRHAEAALQAARNRAQSRAEAALQDSLHRQWVATAKVAAKRIALADKLTGAIAEVAAGYRELIALDQELAKAPTDAIGARAKLGADALWKAIALQAVREGCPATSWPWGADQAPSLRSHVEESAGVLLKERRA